MAEGGIPHYINLLAALAPNMGVILAVKTILVFPLMYHTFNGFRHMMWDTGNNLEIENVYRTGYAVIVLSLIATVALIGATS